MAKSRRNQSLTPPFQGYVPVYVDDKSKASIKKNLGTPQDFCNRFIKYAEDGYRVTISWDDYNECMSCSLYDTKSSRPSAGYVLAAKHVDLVVAISTLIYLHEVVYADGWDIEHSNSKASVNW